MTSKLRKSMCAAALACLLASAPASAHRIDLGQVTTAVRAEAQTFGTVDQVKCWRATVGTRHLRHLAACVAWWVHMPDGASCALFYQARFAPHSGRLQVRQSFRPWCSER